MVLLQVISMVMQKMTNGHISKVTFVILGAFILILLGIIFSEMLPTRVGDNMPLILGIIMLVESIYSMH